MNLLHTHQKKSETFDDYFIRLRDTFYDRLDKLTYKGKPIYLYDRDQKHSDIFYHCVSSKEENNRIIDKERLDYVLTIPVIISNVDNHPNVLSFIDGNKEILYFLNEGKDYIVVLEPYKSMYKLITGYLLTKPSTMNFFSRQMLLELDSIESSHSIALTELFKVKSSIKTIYVDRDIREWLTIHFTHNLVYRIVANAIHHELDEVIFLSPKNHQQNFGDAIEKHIITLTRFSGELSDSEKKLLENFETAIVQMEAIHADDSLDYDERFIKNFTYLKDTLLEITSTENIMQAGKTLRFQYGLIIPRILFYKYHRQFPEIIGAIKSTSDIVKHRVQKTYKIPNEENQSTFLSEKKYNSYYKKYLVKLFILFKSVLVD